VVARRFPLSVTKVPIQRRRSKNHIQSDINQFLVSQMLRPGPNRVNGLIVGEKVRRERRWTFSGCNSRPGTGSLHPVAIEAAAEATKLSELSM
jgi:hypothetical protein